MLKPPIHGGTTLTRDVKRELEFVRLRAANLHLRSMVQDRRLREEQANRAAERTEYRKQVELAKLGHILYRLLDASCALLYIGITNDLSRRLIEHSLTRPWWPEVAWWYGELYPSRAELEAVERLAIIREEPRYNIIHARAVTL